MDTVITKRRGTTLRIATFILAGCSLIYELMIAQLISVFAGNTVVWYALTIGLFLAGMGVGAVLVSPTLRRFQTVTALFWTELVLCLFGALVPFVLHFAALRVLWGGEADQWIVQGAGFFILAIGFILLIGLCTGIELPLLMQRARELGAKDQSVSSTQLLAADYFGSLAGALVFSLLLWPNLEPTQIGLGVAALNLLVAIIIVASPNPLPGHKMRIASLAVLTAMLMALLGTSDEFMRFFLRRYYAIGPSNASISQIVWPEQELPQVSRIRSPYQTIDLVKAVHHDRSYYLFDLFSDKLKRRPNFPKRSALYLNGEVQFFTDFEEVYHEFFAHVPISAFESIPRRILVLGGGDGLLLRELVKYEDVESVTLVDLDSSMLSFARRAPIMKYINARSFEDPRVRVINGDAYHFIRTTNETFDAIFMDFPEVTDYNLSRLYSSEFYHFVLRHLADKGFAVLNAGTIEYLSIPDEKGLEQVTESNRWARFVETIRAAGAGTVVPFFSRLEFNYPEAIQRVIDLNLTNSPASASKKEKETAAKRFLRYNSASLRSGFIMISKDQRKVSEKFSSNASPLFVLNESRYRLALQSPLPTLSQSELGNNVNSVFQPNWGAKPIWSIRRPVVVYREF